MNLILWTRNRLRTRNRSVFDVQCRFFLPLSLSLSFPAHFRCKGIRCSDVRLMPQCMIWRTILPRAFVHGLHYLHL